MTIYQTGLPSSVANAGSAYAAAGSGAPFGDVISSAVKIDLCRPPYSCTPGTDITTALQSAVNAYVVPGASVELYFSLPGTYNINGAVASGSAGGGSYAGQITFPAIPWTGNGALVKIRGTARNTLIVTAPAVVLQSNAASGNVFSAIPNAGGAYPGWSNLHVMFEDVTVKLPTDPQCGGLDLNCAWHGELDRVLVLGALPGADPTSLTGSGIGVQLPRLTSGGHQVIRDSEIFAVPNGLSIGDHAQIRGDTYIRSCLNGIVGGNSIAAFSDRCYLLGTVNGIVPSGSSSLTIDGFLNWSVS